MKNSSTRKALRHILEHHILNAEYYNAFLVILRLLLKRKKTEDKILGFVLSFRQFESNGKTSKNIAKFKKLCIDILMQIESDAIDSYILDVSYVKHDNAKYTPVSPNVSIYKPFISVINQGNVIVDVHESCFASEKGNNHIFIIKLSTNKRNVAIAYESGISEYEDYPTLHLRDNDSNERLVTSIVLMDFKGFAYFNTPNCYKGDVRFTLIDNKIKDLLI